MRSTDTTSEKSSAIALDRDFIVLLRSGASTLFERRDKEPKFKEGDILIVKEPWRNIRGKVEYKADFVSDATFGRPDYDWHWNYSNVMPIEYARYAIAVESVKEIPYVDYLAESGGNEIYYNGRAFSCPNCPKDRWFREAREPKPPKSETVWAIRYGKLQPIDTIVPERKMLSERAFDISGPPPYCEGCKGQKRTQVPWQAQRPCAICRAQLCGNMLPLDNICLACAKKHSRCASCARPL